MQFDKPRFGNLVDSSHLEVLKAKEMGQNIEISIDPKLLQFAAGAFDLQLKAIEKALQCEKVEHQKTKDALVIAKQETATARVELKDANALLQEKRES